MEVCGCTSVGMLSVFKLVRGERFFSLLLLAWYIFNSMCMCKCVCLCACGCCTGSERVFWFWDVYFLLIYMMIMNIMLFFCGCFFFFFLVPSKPTLFIICTRRIMTLRMWEYSSFGTGNVSVELLAHSRAELYNLVYRSAILGSSSERKCL